TNTTLIDEVITEANLYSTTMTSSAVYFENVTILSAVSGLTSVWGSRYEFPSGWLKSIIFETFNDTHHPPYLSYFELEQYVEPEPADPLAVNPEHNTIGISVGDEQILEMVKVVSPEPTEWQLGYQLRLRVLEISPTMILISSETLDTFGTAVDYLEIDINRSTLNPLDYILSTNVTLIHDVFDTQSDFITSYTGEIVTLNFTLSILSSDLHIEMIFDLQTGWIVSYHIKMGTGPELNEILMVAESTLTTTLSTSPTSTSKTTTEEPDGKTTTTSTTIPGISPYPGILSILLSTLIILIGRKWRR
ncbi:MAG: hypothetical protein ACW98F_05830, partial [Candidatus Hodarchaeales archaeon]